MNTEENKQLARKLYDALNDNRNVESSIRSAPMLRMARCSGKTMSAKVSSTGSR